MSNTYSGSTKPCTIGSCPPLSPTLSHGIFQPHQSFIGFWNTLNWLPLNAVLPAVTVLRMRLLLILSLVRHLRLMDCNSSEWSSLSSLSIVALPGSFPYHPAFFTSLLSSWSETAVYICLLVCFLSLLLHISSKERHVCLLLYHKHSTQNSQPHIVSVQ